MEYVIRTAKREDLPRIEEIYAYARQFMAETGNPNQWGETTPQSSLLEDDIEKGLLFVQTHEDSTYGGYRHDSRSIVSWRQHLKLHVGILEG